MREQTKQPIPTVEHSGTSQNEWGGTDYRGPAGTARLTNEDGYISVFFFTRCCGGNGCGCILQWTATFSSGTPEQLSNAAFDHAKRLADGVDPDATSAEPSGFPAISDAVRSARRISAARRSARRSR